jgi:hypothetical protein
VTTSWKWTSKKFARWGKLMKILYFDDRGVNELHIPVVSWIYDIVKNWNCEHGWILNQIQHFSLVMKFW